MINLPSIYAAGKIWHASKFRTLRDDYSFKINSRWIDLPEDPKDPFIANCKDQLWQLCLENSTKADIMVIYCGDLDEEHRGVIMEAGQAFAAGKPVYCINTANSFSPCPISDVAFTHHALWNWIRDDNRKIDPLEGFARAVSHYMGIEVAEQNVIHGPWGKVRLA